VFCSNNIHPCPGPGVVSINLTAGGPAAELHTPPAGFRKGWLAEQLAPPAGLCGLALTAADLAAGPLPTPSGDYGSAPKAGSRVADIHTQPSNFRRGRIAPTPSENCGSAPRASGLAAEIHASLILQKEWKITNLVPLHVFKARLNATQSDAVGTCTCG